MADISKVSIPNVQNPYDIKDAKSQAALVPVINKGSKNLWNITIPNNLPSGFTITRDTDGGYIFNGTAGSSGVICATNVPFKAATSYVLSGCPSGGSDDSYRLDILRGQNTNYCYGDAVVVSGFTATTYPVRIRIAPNYTCSNLKFYPMLCTKAEWDISHEYVPYGKTNVDLTNENANQQLEIDYAINTGSKNLVWYDREAGSQYTTEGRTFTVLSDGGIKIAGNNVTQTNADFYLNGLWTTTNVIFDLSDKDYYISLSDNIGSTVGGIMFRAYNRSTGSTVASYSATLAARQRILKDKITTIFITITTAVTLPSDGIIVYPMIRPAAITDSTFQPYALPNPTLTQAAIKAVDEGAKNKFDPASAWDSKTAYGVTITRNGDTYSIASGTTQSGDNNFINMGYQANTNLIPAGDWVLSFDTPQQNVRFQACWNGTLQANASFGNNCFFTVPKNTTDSWFRILLKGSTNMAGTSFKIMLCPRVLWEISQKFIPYRPSWQEMADNNKIIEISSQITAESGYTVESPTHLYLQNNIVFGNIFIAKDSGSYSSSLTAVAKLPEKYAPSRQFVNMCGFSAEQWSITNIGYGFIQAQNASSTPQRGQISVKSPTANLNHLMLQVNYPIRLDGTL